MKCVWHKSLLKNAKVSVHQKYSHSHGRSSIPNGLQGARHLPAWRATLPICRRQRHVVFAGSADISMADVEKLKYLQLQAALAARKMSSLGKKHELVARLKEALRNEALAAGTEEPTTSSAGLLSAEAASSGPEESEEAVKAQLRVQLEQLPYKEVVQQLTLRLMNASGRKALLIDRLVEAMYAETVGTLAGSSLGTLVARQPVAAPTESVAGGVLEGDADLEAFIAALESEPYARVRTLLQQRRLPSAGRKEVLVRRLAEALLVEQQQRKLQEQQDATSKTASMHVLKLVEHFNVDNPELAVAELLSALEQHKDTELEDMCKAVSCRPDSVSGGRPELMAFLADAVMRLAASKAQGGSDLWQELQRVASDETQVGASQVAAAGTAALPAGIDGTLADVHAMQLPALRAALRRKGMSDKGTKIELVERLLTAQRNEPSIETELQELLTVQLERMSLFELLNAALDQQWDVATDLSSCQSLPVAQSLMKDRCRRHMAELGSSGARLRWVLDFALKGAERQLIEPKDPSTRVSVVFSAPPALLPSALSGVARLVEALHTRGDLGIYSNSFNYPSCLSQLQVEGSNPCAQQLLNEAQVGVAVEVLFVADDGQVFELPLNYVLSCTPETLLAEYGGKATRRLASLQGLTDYLQQSNCAAVLPMVLGGGHTRKNVLTALQNVGSAYVGTPVGGADALRKDRLQQRLFELGYPSLPTLTVSAQQALATDNLVDTIHNWVNQHGWTDPSKQVLVVKPASSCGSFGVQPVRGSEAAAAAVQALHTAGLDGDDVVVELYWLRERVDGKKAVEFTVTVMEAPGGPVALLPTEVELWDLERQIYDSDVELLEWQLQQEGQTAEVIQQDVRDALASAQLDALLDVYTPARTTLPNQQVRLISPPRLSRKTVHHVRHAAAKLFQQLGLRDIATFDGFLLLDPEWEKAYDPNPEDPYPTLPDPSPAILDILIKEEEQRRANEELPLEEYCDMTVPSVRLDAFDPSTRCNGPEATIHFFDINTHIDPQPGSKLCLQAAEMGLAPAALLRNIINRALARAGHPALPLDEAIDPAPTAAEMDVGLDEDVDGAERVYTKDYNWLADPEDYSRVDELIEVPPQSLGDIEELDEYDDTVVPQGWLNEDFTPPPGWKTYDQSLAEAETVTAPHTESEAESVAAELQQDRITSNSTATTSNSEEVRKRGRPKFQYKLVESQTERGQAFQAELFTNQMFFDVPGFKNSEMDWKLKCIDSIASQEVPAQDPEEGLSGVAENGTSSDGLLNRQKVWLLVGGDDSQRHASLAAGINMWSKLQRLKDLQVELFLLSPMASGLNYLERRKNLLKRRVELKAWGFVEEDLPTAYQLPSIRYPMLNCPSVADRLVWVAPLPHFMRGNADEIAEHCERTYALSSVSEYSLPDLSKQRLQSQVETQMEMHRAGVQGVGGLWAGRPNALPPAPLRMDLGRLVSMAKKHKAVVLNLVRGGVGADGCIERLLQHLDVAHMGSSWTTYEACWDKMGVQEALVGMDENGIYVTPRVELPTDTLVGNSTSVEDAADLLQAVQVSLDEATTLVVKPNMEAGGCGVAVLDSPEDILLYFEAYRQGWPVLKANSLSKPHAPIMLPPFMPTTFVFEPYIPSDCICLDASGGFRWARNAQEEGSNPWVEVQLTMMGPVGNIKVLPPTLIAWTDIDQANGGRKVPITPVPSWCASKDAVSECMLRARLVADRMALQGLVVVDGFMHCETGELYVLEVNTQPNLDSSASVFAQALASGDFSSPIDLARHLVHMAASPPPEAEPAPMALPRAVGLDEDEALLDAVDLFGDEGEEIETDFGAGNSVEGDGADALIDALTDDADDELYQNTDILYKEGVGEQDEELDVDESFDEDDSYFSFSDR